MLEGLEPGNVLSIDDDLFDVVDIDRAAYVQAARLGDHSLVIAAVTVVVVWPMARVPSWVDTYQGVPRVMSLSRNVSIVKVGGT